MQTLFSPACTQGLLHGCACKHLPNSYCQNHQLQLLPRVLELLDGCSYTEVTRDIRSATRQDIEAISIKLKLTPSEEQLFSLRLTTVAR